MPSFDASPWSRLAIRFEIRTKLSSVYPNCDPPARSVAQLPGSIYPTATRYPGPANASIFRQKEAPCTIGIVRNASGSEGLPDHGRLPTGNDGTSVELEPIGSRSDIVE